jgi:hypothetical protein
MKKATRLGNSIFVTNIRPGFIDTEMAKVFYDRM